MKIMMPLILSLAASLPAFAQTSSDQKVDPALLDAAKRLSAGPQTTKAQAVIPRAATNSVQQLQPVGPGGLPSPLVGPGGLPPASLDRSTNGGHATTLDVTTHDIQVHLNPDHKSGTFRTPYGVCQFTFSLGSIRGDTGAAGGGHAGLIKATCEGREGSAAEGVWHLQKDGAIHAHLKTSAGHEYNFKL